MRPRALVTGAAVRVGRAIALELASSGFDVCVHHNRSEAEAQAVVRACRERGATAFSVAADLALPDGCALLAEAVRERWDALHLLVNNASIFEAVPFEQLDATAWDRMFAINLRAPALHARDLLPLLRAASAATVGGPDEQGGLVVHLCDIGAERPATGYAHYSASKAGLVMLVKAMAVELAPRVRTVGVSPGQVAWPESYDDALRARLLRRIPMGRAGSPEDVARLVRFVAMEAHYLNGVVIPVDGGLSCRY
jgi:pteridine reductase